MSLDYIRRETASEEENKEYLKNRIIGDQEKGEFWLERFWRKTKISFEALKRRCSLPNGEPVDFYLIETTYGTFGYHVVDKNKKPCWDEGIKIICQRCGKTYSIQQEAKLFDERICCLCQSCKMKEVATQKTMWQRFEQTMQEKYGCKRPIQNPEIRRRTEKTCLEKYGVDTPLKSSEVKIKVAKTCIERYGVDNPFKTKIFQEKASENFKKKYGSANVWETEIGKKIRKANSFGISSEQIEFFTMLQKELNTTILFGEKEMMVLSPKSVYFIDGFIEEYGVAVEFNGDYWHANPKKYKPDDIIYFPGKQEKVSDIWEKDAQRNVNIEFSLNVKVVIVWEGDFLKDKTGTIKRIAKEIRNVKRNRRIG